MTNNSFSPFMLILFTMYCMVLILDGNSEIGAHLWCDIGQLICLKHLFRPSAVTYLIFSSSQKRPILLQTHATFSGLTFKKKVR